MNARDLLEEWEAGEKTGVRPSRAQVLRPHLIEYTSLYVPHRHAALEAWLPRFRGQITRFLREAAEAEEEEEALASEASD